MKRDRKYDWKAVALTQDEDQSPVGPAVGALETEGWQLVQVYAVLLRTFGLFRKEKD